MENVLIACTTIGVLFLLFGIPFGFAAYNRRLKHQEMIAMIEKGLVEAPRADEGGRNTLRWGIVITALGLAFSLGLYPLGFIGGGAHFPLHFGPWMLIGLVPTFFGLALIFIYQLTKPKDEGDDQD